MLRGECCAKRGAADVDDAAEQVAALDCVRGAAVPLVARGVHKFSRAQNLRDL
jgi:hypothetical protein